MLKFSTQVQCLGRIIFGQDDRIGARHHRADAGAGAGNVEARHCQQRDIARDRLLPLAHLLPARHRIAAGEDRSVGHHRALGLAGGARSIELQGVVFRLHLVRGRCGGKTVAPGAVIGAGIFGRVDADHQFDMRHRSAHLLDHRRETFAHEHHAGLRIVEDIGNLGRGEAPVDRGHHRADPRRADESLEIERVVLAEERDAITRLHPQRDQPVRHPVRALVQLREADLLVAIGEGDHVALTLGVFRHDVAE
jgi:hypothetical protein